MASVSKEADRLHKCLLTDLSDMMDPNNPTYKNFIPCLVSDSLPRGRLSVVQQNPSDVFVLMEERGVLKVGEYQYLEEALKASRYMNILDRLKNAEKCIIRQMRKRSYIDDPADGDSSNTDVREIQLSLIKAYKHIQIISISPIFNNAVNLKSLEDFFTDIVIEEEIEGYTQKMKDEKQVDKVKVTSFRQIFHKDDKRLTRIILKGPAGQGKSTFCRKLVHTWCSVQNKKLNHLMYTRISETSETNGLKDEDEMLMFDVLLYICLRDISDEKTLMDVLYTQFPLHESQVLSHRLHIEGLIGQAENNKVLLIMDGLDEMDNSSSFIKKIMQRSLYPHLTVLATTRPWKIDQLSLIRSADIDLLLDLQGFSYENSMLFAKRIFDKYYKDHSVLEQFEKDIRTNSVIRGLIHVPLLLLFIVHVWHGKKSFPQTLHELYVDILNVLADRYIEGKGRNQESKETEDEKKYLLRKTWPLKSTAFILTPRLRNLSLVQHFGEEFLASLCEVANHFLMTDAKETSLVFEEKALVELLGKEGSSKMRTALDVGILSKSDMPEILWKKIRLTFLHKTLQEFLAAINICCREDRCNIFIDSLNEHKVLQNENIIMFVAGISTNHCEKISEKIYDVCDKLGTENEISKMHILSGLYSNCVREACGEPISMKLHTLCAVNEEEWNMLQYSLNITYVRTHLRCVNLHGCKFDDDVLDLSQCKSLIDICLVYVNMKGKLLLSKCTHLKCLTLVMCNFDDVTLDLTECISLTELNLQGVAIHGTLLLLKCTHFKSLNLDGGKLDDAKMNLSESASLTMKGELLLSKCTPLKLLNLDGIIFDDATLDLSECTSMSDLSFVNLSMKDKLLLSKCTQLKCLNVNGSNFDDVTLDLSECTSLTKFSLQGMTINGKLLLSKCSQLSCLNLDSSNLYNATLDLSECTSLTDLSLQGVAIRGKLLLSTCTQLKCLNLDGSNFDDATLDLSECTSLTNLSLHNVTIKVKLLLSTCSQLKYRDLEGSKFSDFILNLSEGTSLTDLSLV